MPKLEWSYNGRSIECSSDVAIEMENPIWSDFISALQTMMNAMQVSTLDFEHRIGTDPKEFDYSFVLEDGREWVQELFFDVENDPLMTFDVRGTNKFRVSNFASHRAVRTGLVGLVGRYGVTKLNVVWQ